ncbi:MAG TPA: S9 family peptidase [Pyrinomonadaceae bacterium]|nr:S9 family peptidase [Pyrinomonadaceae bacterium]
MKRIFASVGFVLLLAAAIAAQFSINDLLSLKRVNDPQVSPDGRMVAFSVGTVDKAANKTLTQIWTMNIDGSKQRQITNGTSSSSEPRWSPDGKKLAFVSGGQVYTMDADGTDKHQVTKLSSGADGPTWSPDGNWIGFLSDVYPNCPDDACNAAEDARVEASKVKAHVSERLLFRHWVEWRDRKRTHVFIVPARGGEARDFTPGDFDSPPYAIGQNGQIPFAFSPDSKWLVYTRNPDPIEAISTNSDLYLMPLNGGGAPIDITANNKGYDANPVFTNDGRYLLYVSMPTAGFEADRWTLKRYDLSSKQITEVTAGFDQQVGEFAVSPDSSTVYFIAPERGREPIFSVPVAGGGVKKVLPEISANSLQMSRDGRTLVFAANSMGAPNEIMSVQTDGGLLKQLTKFNDDSLARFNLQKPEDVNWKGGANANVHGFIVKPPNFDPARKYPLIVLIHGGPQGAWFNAWSNRWNPQLWASRGYVVFMPNPQGSTGYGQAFVNAVSKDWGGAAFQSIANGIAMMAKQPYVDPSRIGAAGASYGGYMIDWFLGHNNDPRFHIKTFLSHAGVYNLESMAGATEELWFVNWEFNGMPWEQVDNPKRPNLYNRYSPHKFAKNFNTPTLVTAGELDFRVPYDQSLQLYTTLQLKHVPSKLILFPDEGHWILKPQNSEFWYNNVLDWFKKYLNP